MTQLLSVLCSFMLTFSLWACGNGEVKQPSTMKPYKPPLVTEKPTPSAPDSNQVNAKIQITTEEGNIIIFQLNDSTAAEALCDQLPLTVSVENFGGNEKIFYPPEKLDTSNTPLAKGPAGTLAYYAPWGDVAIYYGECGGASSLYELGEALSGAEYISEMTGEIKIDIVEISPLKPADSESAPKSSAQYSSKSPETSSEVASAPKQTQRSAQTPPPVQTPPSNVPEAPPKEDETVESIQVTAGNKTFTATLAENTAVDAFVELMKTAPIVINMSDYSGFEKVGSLGISLPTSNSNITAQEGDIILYSGNQSVLFYGSNSWSYTRLGRIDYLSDWEEALGIGDVTVTFSI